MIVRRLVHVQRSALALVAALLTTACGADGDAEPPAELEPAVVFALDRAAEADAVIPLLIERQRALFAAIQGNDSERMSEYLLPDFHWNPGFAGTAGMPTPGGADYLAMLAGYRPASLAELPAAYDVDRMTDDVAWVYAHRPDSAGGIVTVWLRRADAWRAQWAHDESIELAEWQERRRRAEEMRRQQR
jgi:hypothetical protein